MVGGHRVCTSKRGQGAATTVDRGQNVVVEGNWIRAASDHARPVVLVGLGPVVIGLRVGAAADREDAAPIVHGRSRVVVERRLERAARKSAAAVVKHRFCCVVGGCRVEAAARAVDASYLRACRRRVEIYRGDVHATEDIGLARAVVETSRGLKVDRGTAGASAHERDATVVVHRRCTHKVGRRRQHAAQDCGVAPARIDVGRCEEVGRAGVSTAENGLDARCVHGGEGVVVESSAIRTPVDSVDAGGDVWRIGHRERVVVERGWVRASGDGEHAANIGVCERVVVDGGGVDASFHRHEARSSVNIRLWAVVVRLGIGATRSREDALAVRRQRGGVVVQRLRERAAHALG